MTGQPALSVQNLGKAWQRDKHRRVLLFDGLGFDVALGESVAVTGPSGAGKSSLLHVLGGLDPFYTGEMTLAGFAMGTQSTSQRARIRRQHVGMALQQGGLIGTLNVRDNITLACWLSGHTPDAGRCEAILDTLQMRHLADSYPGALSGGEAARVSVGRAVFNAPTLIVCDEPTGALDATSAACVLTLLQEAVAQGSALIVATHDLRVADAMQRTATLSHGTLVWQDQS